jgi:hypothetical protein
LSTPSKSKKPGPGIFSTTEVMRSAGAPDWNSIPQNPGVLFANPAAKPLMVAPCRSAETQLVSEHDGSIAMDQYAIRQMPSITSCKCEPLTIAPSPDPDFNFPLSVTGISEQGQVTSNWEFYDDCDFFHTGMFDARPLRMIGGIFVYDGDATSADAINASGQVTGFSALTSIT